MHIAHFTVYVVYSIQYTYVHVVSQELGAYSSYSYNIAIVYTLYGLYCIWLFIIHLTAVLTANQISFCSVIYLGHPMKMMHLSNSLVDMIATKMSQPSHVSFVHLSAMKYRYLIGS